MSDPLVYDLTISSLKEINLYFPAKIATGRCSLRIDPSLLELVAAGRGRYERFLQRQGGYVYGSTTAPGNRAKQMLAPEDSARQGSTLGAFIPAIRASPAE